MSSIRSRGALQCILQCIPRQLRHGKGGGFVVSKTFPDADVYTEVPSENPTPTTGSWGGCIFLVTVDLATNPVGERESKWTSARITISPNREIRLSNVPSTALSGLDSVLIFIEIQAKRRINNEIHNVK